jgi:hypothetical protein
MDSDQGVWPQSDFAWLGLMRKARLECDEAVAESRLVITSTREAIAFLDQLAPRPAPRAARQPLAP